MNIKEAKLQIKNTVSAYFTCDEFGNFIIPIERQRPILLMGAPGIGKTAIMEQVAQELNVALVSYSMTHHTRQSALGLPFITRKDFGGTEYDVSEYTMSEIIASIYESMEKTGLNKGILFLDEINCVSETLAPSMLQFLQFKVFGRHQVPEGWIVVTAGNPPEFNKSVREFDIVTLDRLKRIDVEPDFEIWKEYAYKIGVHPAILTYLEIKKNNFYRVETTVDGKRFVTARGWVDLSQMIQLYERLGYPVNDKLIGQYLQEKKISTDFSIYYELFNKYILDYNIDAILAGKSNDVIKDRAKSAKFDERISLLSLLFTAVSGQMREVVEREQVLKEVMQILKAAIQKMSARGSNPVDILEKEIQTLQKKLARGKQNKTLSSDALLSGNQILKILQEQYLALSESNIELNGNSAYQIISKDFNSKAQLLTKKSKEVGEMLENVFKFVEEIFGEGQELLILVTELTTNAQTAKFISRFGSEAYFKHNKNLLFYERQKSLIKDLEDLTLFEKK